VFLKVLIAQVEKRMAHASPEEAKARVEPIRASLSADPQIARYAAKAGEDDGFPSQVGKVYEHARAHGLALA